MSFIKLSNETYSSVTNSNERFANFNSSPKSTGRTMIVFKGLMSLVNPIGGDPIKAAVKFFRDNDDDEDTSGNWSRRAISYVGSVKTARMFAADVSFTHITFPLCFTTKMETVSSFNKNFKMSSGDYRRLRKNEPAIFESYIDGRFQTFIAKDGTIKKGCPEQLEAFVHYIYNESRGQMIITGLKGIRGDNTFRLTAPRVHSKGRNFGPDDIGEEAILNFFLGHTCKENCQIGWCHPRSSLQSVRGRGHVANVISTNQRAGSATPPPSYMSVIRLVCDNECRRVRMGGNSVVVLPRYTRQAGIEQNSDSNNNNRVSDAVSALQCG